MKLFLFLFQSQSQRSREKCPDFHSRVLGFARLTNEVIMIMITSLQLTYTCFKISTIALDRSSPKSDKYIIYISKFGDCFCFCLCFWCWSKHFPKFVETQMSRHGSRNSLGVMFFLRQRSIRT